ncbi:nucleoside-diphosphate kinase [Patescibacteria group bacterium]|nr:nucleoside-diphosphate kinase [Patescibacteria group bacterium]
MVKKEVQFNTHDINSSSVLRRGVISRSFFEDNRQQEGASAELALSKLEREKLGKIIDVLEHPGLGRLIDEGKITLGAVKARTEMSKLPLDQSKAALDRDEEGEAMIIGMINPPLEPLFTVSVALESADLDEFYAEVKPTLMQKKEPGAEETIWDSYSTHMLSGPITYFLLYDATGNAVLNWREQMGKTNPLSAAPGTIRGKYAFSTNKNLVHGSSGDTPAERAQNVRTEVKWLNKKLRKILVTKPEMLINLGEEFLRGLGVIEYTDKLLSVGRFIKSRRVGSEAFLSAYSITVENSRGEVETRYLAEKSIFSTGGDLTYKTQRMFKRLKLLQDHGVKTPKLYGTVGADLYEEFILNAKNSRELITEIKSDKTPVKTREALLKMLVRIAEVLDSQGFAPIGNFWHDVIFKGQDVYYVDGGYDLGEPNPNNPSTRSREQLEKEFKGLGFDSLLPKASLREHC